MALLAVSGSMAYEDEELRGIDIEARIIGEFMTRLQESTVRFEIVEGMEQVINEDGFGGEERIVDAVESFLLNNED